MPATAPTKLRLVELARRDAIESIVEWVWSGDTASKLFESLGEELPGFDAEAQADLLERVGELSDTVAALTGLNLMDEVYSALNEQEGDGIAGEDFEEPNSSDGYLEDVAGSNMQSGFSRGKVDEDDDSDDWWEYVTQPGACPICEPLDGTQAPQDDGIWADRIPPLHPECVCDLKTIPPQKIRATEHDVPSEARGRSGWGDPRKRFDPDLSDKPAALLPAYHEKLRNLRRNE